MSIEIDHIGIAVNSLDNRSPFWVALGLMMEDDEELPNDGVIARFFSMNGGSDISPKIELLQPTSPDSPIGRFIEKRGEGIQQIAFRVENIEHTISVLLENGVQMIDETPRVGAHGSMIAFVHPKSTGGVLVEILQRT
tara:strand:- start:83 stop:496 length:414 start_codon:yes stop_codon:yes gene_type:complete